MRSSRHQRRPAAPEACRSRYPLDDLQVAQPAGRLLEVGLERVRRILVLGVALLLLELLRLEEGDRVRLGGQPGLEAPEQRPAARKVARLEERGAHGDVGGRLGTALDRTHAVADLEAGVPEAADEALERVAVPFARLLGEQDQQVDVGTGVELAAPVAAGGDERRARRHGGLRPQRLDVAVDELRVLAQQRPGMRAAQIGGTQRFALRLDRAARAH